MDASSGLHTARRIWKLFQSCKICLYSRDKSIHQKPLFQYMMNGLNFSHVLTCKRPVHVLPPVRQETLCYNPKPGWPQQASVSWHHFTQFCFSDIGCALHLFWIWLQVHISFGQEYIIHFMLSPHCWFPICRGISRTVMKSCQECEVLGGQLRGLYAKLMLQLPHGCCFCTLKIQKAKLIQDETIAPFLMNGRLNKLSSSLRR